MSHRLKYPEGSLYNLLERRRRRGMNLRRLSWRVYLVRRSVPALLVLLLLASIAGLLLRARG